MTDKKSRLTELAVVFLKLGSISFGGPAALISMMENEVVVRKKWMTHEHYLDLIGATNLIPGPNAAEMAMHCGYERAGRSGLVAAGLSFFLPAVIITGILAWFYSLYGQVPQVESFIYGIKPAVIAIIISAIIPLGKKALKTTALGIIGILVLIAGFLGINEILSLLSAGAVSLVYYLIKNKPEDGFKNGFKTNIIPAISIPAAAAFLVQSFNVKIFLIFLKVGAVLYGSGYVLFAFLDGELVSNGLLSRQVLVDAVAAGQFTPGPVLSTATFIGWQMNGLWGALAATIGIFLPSFFFVFFLNPLIPKIRKSKIFTAFLDGVNIASVALIIFIGLTMGIEVLTGWKTIIIAITSIAVIFRFEKINRAFIVIGGAGLGYLLTLI
jgi:chromate transporter